MYFNDNETIIPIQIYKNNNDSVEYFIFENYTYFDIWHTYYVRGLNNNLNWTELIQI